MAIVKTDNTHYTAIADAIRSKSLCYGDLYTPAQMAAAITAIPYESETVIPAYGADDLVIPIDDEVAMVAVYIEKPKSYGEYGGVFAMNMLWVRSLPLMPITVTYDPNVLSCGYGAGSYFCTVSEDSLTIHPVANFPLLVGQEYRIIKVRGYTTE